MELVLIYLLHPLISVIFTEVWVQDNLAFKGGSLQKPPGQPADPKQRHRTMSLPSKVDFLKNLIPDPCISSALCKPRIVDNLPPSNNISIEAESEPKPNQQEQQPSTL